jgi:hypothetical protein
MANIDRIANVQISLNTTPISQEGFSTLLVVGYHPYTLNRVNSYTSPDAMLDDGFTSDDPLYVAVNDGFSQIPRPAQIKIGRRQIDVVNIEPKAVTNASEYKVTIGKKAVDGSVTKTDYTFTSGAAATATEIVTGLQGLITADANAPVTATVAVDELVLTNKTAGQPFSVKLSSLLKIAAYTAGAETVAETMTAIKNEDNDWYGWSLTSRLQADILAAANWTEGQRKLFGCAIAEEGAKDAAVSTDTGSKLMEGNYYRTHWWYHKDAATDYPEVAIMARCFAIDPGGETWANKKLAGITTDALTETEYNAITAKNGNTFECFRKVTITQNGKVAAGEWIDVIRFRDWLQEEISVRVFNRMINSDKIPYTDGGIAIIENQIRGALNLGQQRGGIAPSEFDDENKENPGFVVNVPLNYNISAVDKANRVLNDVKFTARLAGAIHVVNVKGSLTYENLA